MNHDITRRQAVMAGGGVAGAWAGPRWLARLDDERPAPLSDQSTPTTAPSNPEPIGAFREMSEKTLQHGVDLVQTTGWAQAGDGGHALYRYDAAVDAAYVAANPRSSFLSSNGRGFRLAHSGKVNSRWFGALGGPVASAIGIVSGSTAWKSLPDDTAGLQASIDYAIANRCELYTPPGGYRITRALLVASWNGTSFSTVSLKWSGGSRSGFGAPDPSGTAIVCHHKDTFGIGIQMARKMRIEGISLYGQNQIFPNYAGMNDITNYVVNGCRDTRYSPYTAIAIDPFGRKSASNTGGSWPGIGNGTIGFPGYSAYYTDHYQYSSGINFDGVDVSGFVVGFSIDLPGDSNQGDSMRWDSCYINAMKAGMAIGQSQSDVINMYHCSIGSCYWGITAINYGRKNGNFPHVFGMNMGYVKYLFMADPSVGEVDISGVHAESFRAIGFFGRGGSSGQNPVALRNSFFNITTGSGPVSGIAHIASPDTHLVTFGDLVFDNCYVGSSDQLPLRFVQAGDARITFRNTAQGSLGLNPADGPCVLARYDQQHCFRYDGARAHNDLGNPGGSSAMDNALRLQTFGLASSRYFATAGQTVTDVFNSTQYLVGKSIGLAQLGSLPYINHGNGTGTITLANAANWLRINSVIELGTGKPLENWDTTLSLDGFQVKLGKVTAITGSRVTVVGVPEHLPSGTYAFAVTWQMRLHLPTVMSVTSGSTAVTAISAGAMDPKYPSWQRGDYVRGSNLAPGTYWLSLDYINKTGLLSQPATGTVTAMRAFDADLQKLAAGTPV